MIDTLDLKLKLRSSPLFFGTFYKFKERDNFRARVVRPGDAAVIEGFPRSANTFATYAFLESQGADTRFGNHFHTPAQFYLARKYGIPAILVIRNPRDACLSFMVFSHSDDASDALRRYIAFHEPLLAIRDAFLVAPFDEITRDFGRVLQRANERFSASIKPFVHSDENVRRVRDAIERDRAARWRASAGGADPMTHTLPSEAKARRKAEIEKAYDAPALARLRHEAEALFAELTTPRTAEAASDDRAGK
jgi:hypothetical protein